MAENEKNEKKIIIDEDWKSQAKQEKEKLSQQQQEEEKQQEPVQMPPADFLGLVNILTTQAYFALGILKDDEDAEPQINWELAKFHIDMLAVLEEKTKGNLNEQENSLLSTCLENARMVYVKLSE